jgi:hypothetical protein
VDLRLGRIRPTVADVLQRRSREDDRILGHDRNALAQILQRQGLNRRAIDAHGARAGVVVTQQQLEDGALAGAAGADQRDRFAGRDGERKIRQRRCGRARRVVKRDCFKFNS